LDKNIITNVIHPRLAVQVRDNLPNMIFSPVLARCAQGNHETKKHYGVAGIICADLLFPIGLFCLE
jgi:hypothetical protein